VITGGGFNVTTDTDGTQFHAAALFASDLTTLAKGSHDSFNGILNLRLTVYNGGLSEFKDFQVKFGGTWGKDGDGTIYSRLKASTDPVSTPIFLSDGTQFQVQIYTTTPPTFQSQPVRGDIWGNITVLKGSNGGGGGPSQTPEPSTIVLSCLGLSCVGFGAWRRRRQAAVDANLPA
jgi:hypothetical protein